MNGILPQELYDHFVVLSVAICILISPKLTQQHSQYACELLKYDFNKSRELYSREFLVYNVHSLLHLAKDAEEFGSLDQCSTFPFENYLQKLLKMVRSAKNPVAQIVKRHRESQHTGDIHQIALDSVTEKCH